MLQLVGLCACIATLIAVCRNVVRARSTAHHHQAIRYLLGLSLGLAASAVMLVLVVTASGVWTWFAALFAGWMTWSAFGTTPHRRDDAESVVRVGDSIVLESELDQFIERNSAAAANEEGPDEST